MIMAEVVLHRPDQEPETTLLRFGEYQPHILEIIRIGSERFEVLSVQYNFGKHNWSGASYERYFQEAKFYNLEARLI